MNDDDQVYIARYWMGDKAWKIAFRHKAGRRVKPGTVTLTVTDADRNER